MELILHVLMLFIGINCLIKLSFWKTWQTVLFGLLCAIFVLYSQSYAITLSKTRLEALMHDTLILQDLAVWITFESAICFGFCIVTLRQLFGKMKPKKSRLLYLYPGLLIFPVLFYVQVQLIFGLPGVSFEKISWLLGSVVFLLIPLGSLLFKQLFPETELKLEVHFLLSLFVCIIGLLTTVNGNTTYKSTASETSLIDIGLTFLLFASFFLVGIFFTRLKMIIRNKRLLQNK